MKIHFLGTAGSIVSKDRDNTALLIELDENLILIDCPGSVVQKIKKLGFDPNSLTDVIITHDHTDHVYGLPSLIHSLWLMGRKDSYAGTRSWESSHTGTYQSRFNDRSHVLPHYEHGSQYLSKR